MSERNEWTLLLAALLALVLLILLTSGCAMFVPDEHKQAVAYSWASVHSMIERHDAGSDLDPWPYLRSLDEELYYEMLWLFRKDPTEKPAEKYSRVWLPGWEERRLKK